MLSNERCYCRGKKCGTDEWVYGYLYEEREGNISILIPRIDLTWYDKNKCYIRDAEIHLVDWDTVCRFTGCYDDGGSPIFEKDVLRRRIHKEIETGFVSFHDGAFGVYLDEKGGILLSSFLDAPSNIVGNVVDNPEYLGE